MKTFILLITTLLFAISCTDERESEHFNPNHAIKVNFETKKATEGGKELIIANKNETEIFSKIIKGQELPSNIKFETICSGSNDKGLHFSYLNITGDINGLFLVLHDENRVLSYRLNSVLRKLSFKVDNGNLDHIPDIGKMILCLYLQNGKYRRIGGESS